MRLHVPHETAIWGRLGEGWGVALGLEFNAKEIYPSNRFTITQSPLCADNDEVKTKVSSLGNNLLQKMTYFMFSGIKFRFHLL